MEEQLIRLTCKKFGLEGEYRSYKQLTAGHINSTYLVNFFRHGENKEYILQKINTFVFKNPVEMMDNVSDVTKYIRAKIKEGGQSAKRLVLHFQPCGERYYVNDETGFWRCYRYIDNSVTFNMTDDLTVIEEAGKAFGEFQMYLSDYPVEKLHIVIPHFHNTVSRYEAFEAAVAADKIGRAESIRREIDDYRRLYDTATTMYRMQTVGKLPLKVTHNDTKTNNVLFDGNTFEHLAVLDLDTVMPGLIGFDFGDAIRFVANTCTEDETDLSKVAIDMKKYKAFTGGFVSKVGNTLSENEKNTLALGAITMTVECGVRFLTDYLNGDEYFRIHYPSQNLDRSRCQLALAQNMLLHYDEMKEIVNAFL